MKRLQDWANHYFPDRGGLWDTDLQEIFALMASVNGPPRHKDEEPLAVLADRKGYEVLLGRRRKGQFQEGKWVIQLWGMPGKVEEFPILRVPRNSYQKSEQAARKWLLKQGDKT